MSPGEQWLTTLGAVAQVGSLYICCCMAGDRQQCSEGYKQACTDCLKAERLRAGVRCSTALCEAGVGRK